METNGMEKKDLVILLRLEIAVLFVIIFFTLS